MNDKYRFKLFFLSVSSALLVCMNSFAAESNAFTSMPNSCHTISVEQMGFELPISVQKLTKKQREKINTVINDARIQACVLQMQYDGFLQQIIALFFENQEISKEELKPYFDQLFSLTQNEVENKTKTVIAFRHILSAQEWEKSKIKLIRFNSVTDQLMKQQEALRESYKVLVGNNESIQSILSTSLCLKNNPKIKILEQLISKLSLTDIQAEQIRSIMQNQEKQSCSARQNKRRLLEQLLGNLTKIDDQIKDIRYKALFNQLVTQEYLLKTTQIETLFSLIQYLTPEQKAQLRENYMLVKGVL